MMPPAPDIEMRAVDTPVVIEADEETSGAVVEVNAYVVDSAGDADAATVTYASIVRQASAEEETSANA
jgi:hypothetical protein